MRKRILHFLNNCIELLFVPAKDAIEKRAKRDGSPYLEAVIYAKSKYKYTPGRKTDWAYHHAEAQFDMLSKIAKELDDKADSILRLSLTVLTLIVTSLVFLISKVGAAVWILFLPTIIIFFLAILVAIRVRCPGLLPYPPSGERALSYAEYYSNEEEAKGWFAAQFHAASVGQRMVIDYKGNAVYISAIMLIFAIICLALPVLCLTREIIR
jgi:hypothetical protein